MQPHLPGLRGEMRSILGCNRIICEILRGNAGECRKCDFTRYAGNAANCGKMRTAWSPALVTRWSQKNDLNLGMPLSWWRRGKAEQHKTPVTGDFKTTSNPRSNQWGMRSNGGTQFSKFIIFSTKYKPKAGGKQKKTAHLVQGWISLAGIFCPLPPWPFVQPPQQPHARLPWRPLPYPSRILQARPLEGPERHHPLCWRQSREKAKQRKNLSLKKLKHTVWNGEFERFKDESRLTKVTWVETILKTWSRKNLKWIPKIWFKCPESCKCGIKVELNHTMRNQKQTLYPPPPAEIHKHPLMPPLFGQFGPGPANKGSGS